MADIHARIDALEDPMGALEVVLATKWQRYETWWDGPLQCWLLDAPHVVVSAGDGEREGGWQVVRPLLYPFTRLLAQGPEHGEGGRRLASLAVLHLVADGRVGDGATRARLLVLLDGAPGLKAAEGSR